MYYVNEVLYNIASCFCCPSWQLRLRSDNIIGYSCLIACYGTAEPDFVTEFPSEACSTHLELAKKAILGTCPIGLVGAWLAQAHPFVGNPTKST
jgi:hypothetical protein